MEARTRLEHLKRIRRRGISEKKEAYQEGKAHSYDPAKPWDWVFGQLTSKAEADWRWDELESKLFKVDIGVSEPGEHVEHDHPIAATSSSTSRLRPVPRTAPTPTTTTRKRPMPQKHESDNEVDLQALPPAGAVGLHTCNQNGVGLCKGFQVGQCLKMDRMSRCARDGTSADQCARCLDNGHGAHFPAKRTKPVATKRAAKRRRK